MKRALLPLLFELIKFRLLGDPGKYIVVGIDVGRFLQRIDDDMRYFFILYKNLGNHSFIGSPYLGGDALHLLRAIPVSPFDDEGHDETALIWKGYFIQIFVFQFVDDFFVGYPGLKFPLKTGIRVDERKEFWFTIGVF